MKKLLKKTPFYLIFKYIKFILKRKHRLQKIKISSKYDFITLGSPSQGLTFINKKELYESTMISAGLGEDGSFDIEFARKYNANIIIVDPTPKAVNHYNKIIDRLGLENNTSYIKDSGKQPIEAYNLKDIKRNQLKLINKALWIENKTLKFYPPKNPKHVSHTISNYNESEDYIKVKSITIFDVLKDFNLSKNEIKLLKLDIEGAEIEVIADMLKNKFKPNQICVAFDDINHSKNKNEIFKKIDLIDNLLTKNGYKCIHTNRVADFLYVLNA